MAREIKSTFNEATGEFDFDLDGYDGDDCEDEWKRIKKAIEAAGLDFETVEQKKKPRIPNVCARKNKIGGGR